MAHLPLEPSHLLPLSRAHLRHNDEIIHKELEFIIKKYGWPSDRITGDRKTSAGLLLLHSSDSWFYKMDSILITEIKKGNLSPVNYAMIADRVRLRNKLKPILER